MATVRQFHTHDKNYGTFCYMDTKFWTTLLSASSGLKSEALTSCETSGLKFEALVRVYQCTRHNLQHGQTCYSTPQENLTIRARCFDTWLRYLLQVTGCRYTRTYMCSYSLYEWLNH